MDSTNPLSSSDSDNHKSDIQIQLGGEQSDILKVQSSGGPQAICAFYIQPELRDGDPCYFILGKHARELSPTLFIDIPKVPPLNLIFYDPLLQACQSKDNLVSPNDPIISNPLLQACQLKDYPAVLRTLGQGHSKGPGRGERNMFHYLARMKPTPNDPTMLKQSIYFPHVYYTLDLDYRKKLLQETDINGQTPLHIAAQYNAFTFISLACADEPNRNIADTQGKIPVQYFIESNRNKLDDKIFWIFFHMLAVGTALENISNYNFLKL
ncbi:MAG: hypothetical protein M1834_004251 [Cirrosporium novae-zelandiae]|nr:MAG: hypothetical protein M1834_004251 [Cirrosporium novae-zelandiae]